MKLRAHCHLCRLILHGVILLRAIPVWAHPPHERVTGTFQRADGTPISIVQRRVDGIFFADPVSVCFRLTNGTELAHTPLVQDAVVRSLPEAVEIYQFQSTWLPVAGRVESFDGYQLTDLTSSRQVSSLFVHFAAHWVAYLVTLGLGLLFLGLHRSLRAIPNRGWRAATRRVGLTVVEIASGLYAYEILFFEPISPLVLVGCGAIGWVGLRRFRGWKNAPLPRQVAGL